MGVTAESLGDVLDVPALSRPEQKLELTFEAKASLEELTAAYKEQLLEKSEALARAQGMDNVNAAHVNEAEQLLYSKTVEGGGTLRRLGSTIGSACAGASLSLLGAMMYNETLIEPIEGMVLLAALLGGITLASISYND